MSELENMVRQWIREEIAKAKNDERPTEPRYIKATEFAARHSLALSTVREAIADGRLQPVKRMGRAVRIAENAIIAPRPKDDVQQARIRRLLAKHGGAR